MIKYTLKIVEIVDQAKGTKTYYLEKPEDLTCGPGTHTHIAHVGYDVGEVPNKKWVRPMSIMTLQQEGKIGFTTRVPGGCSEFKEKLSQLRVGDEVVLYKLGSRMALRCNDRPIVFFTMGIGVTAVLTDILNYVKDKTGIPALTHLNVEASRDFVFRSKLDPLTDAQYQKQAHLWN
ncbi:MAG: hypothetical protein CVV02_16615 [Firmicutes bacterium HGW-Firmicutes-7]|nr:MAG: hypothetical protein CVV02_16615 [Firmicutes bacterium HGW-Firmicutes-7]